MPSTAPPAVPAAAAAATVQGAPTPAALVAEAAERSVTIDTASITAVFTNRGAQILSWRLKHYKDDHGDPVDLVPSGLPAGTPRPFALRAEDPTVTARLNGALFQATLGDAPVRLTSR